ncbi:hypothetical protein QR98_0099540 [Sarcoptes scabiei]|uniref:Uncharacterized protein n=1 Tax=Sarcoptes scabiei TaxID=52283 RepID=A0A132AKD1_SARSC|nr:hypothetical protein QR98_0099540 [Sarcoptes scabiei]
MNRAKSIHKIKENLTILLKQSFVIRIINQKKSASNLVLIESERMDRLSKVSSIGDKITFGI